MRFLDGIIDTFGLKDLFAGRAHEQAPIKSYQLSPPPPAHPLVALVLEQCAATRPGIRFNASPLHRREFDQVQERINKIIIFSKFNEESWNGLKQAARNLSFRSASQGLLMWKDMHMLLCQPKWERLRLECLKEITDLGTTGAYHTLPEGEKARQFVRTIVEQDPSQPAFTLLLKKIDLIDRPPTRDSIDPAVK